jgi:3-hydroxyacyl-CoA dehydrogenase
MGAGVAAAAALSGDNVKILDVSRERAAEGAIKARERASRRAEIVAGTVTPVSWSDDLSEVELVLEAVVEDATVKAGILRRAVAAVGPRATIATNTSSLSVAALARESGAEERVVGLHFFSPAHTSRLVEAVVQDSLKPEHLRLAVDWARALNKTVVTIADAPGFLVNRVARPLYLEAERLVQAGLTPAEVDEALRSVGFPVGPLEIVDRTGLDVHTTVSRRMYEQLGSPRFRPVPIVQELVDSGHLGLKSGQGFLTYFQGKRVDTHAAPAAPDDLPVRPQLSAPDPSPIARRILVSYINEAALVVDEGYTDARTVDLALKLALGHPHGPFGWIPALGGAKTVAKLVASLSRRLDTVSPPARVLTNGEVGA